MLLEEQSQRPTPKLTPQDIVCLLYAGLFLSYENINLGVDNEMEFVRQGLLPIWLSHLVVEATGFDSFTFDKLISSLVTTATCSALH